MQGLPAPFGPYVLLRLLGSGGMGEVILARQEMGGVGRLVAVKRLHSQNATNESFLRMFLDELRIVSRLSNPNIGHVLDAGRVGSRVYMAMEYLPGRDLETVLKAMERRGTQVPIELAVEIASRIASALEHAHTRRDETGLPLGIVHRDVSPDNVILTVHGEVKLVDFGIAKAKDRLESTRTGIIKGKVTAMAPEQILDRPVDRRTDIFSLGVLFYRMLAGRRPYRAGSVAGMMRLILEHRPPPVIELRPECPKEISDLVSKMMQRSPRDRFFSLSPVLELLDDMIAEKRWMISSRRLADFLREADPTEIEVFDETTTAGMTEGLRNVELRMPDASIGGLHQAGDDSSARTISSDPELPPTVPETPLPAVGIHGEGDGSKESPSAQDEAPTLYGPPDWGAMEKEARRLKRADEPLEPDAATVSFEGSATAGAEAADGGDPETARASLEDMPTMMGVSRHRAVTPAERESSTAETLPPRSVRSTTASHGDAEGAADEGALGEPRRGGRSRHFALLGALFVAAAAGALLLLAPTC